MFSFQICVSFVHLFFDLILKVKKKKKRNLIEIEKQEFSLVRGRKMNKQF